MNWHFELKFRRWYSVVVTGWAERLEWVERGWLRGESQLPSWLVVWPQLPHLNIFLTTLVWRWTESGLERLCTVLGMYVPKQWMLSLLSHILMFLTHTLCIIQSLIWGQKQYSWCWEGLLIPPEILAYLLHMGFLFMLYCSSSTVLASYLSGPFPPSSFNSHSWPPVEPQTPQPGARVWCNKQRQENHTLSQVGFCRASCPLHSSYVPLYSKITTFSWQKVWCHHLFLLNPSVYWRLWRPQTTIFSFFDCVIHSTYISKNKWVCES